MASHIVDNNQESDTPGMPCSVSPLLENSTIAMIPDNTDGDHRKSVSPIPENHVATTQVSSTTEEGKKDESHKSQSRSESSVDKTSTVPFVDTDRLLIFSSEPKTILTSQLACESTLTSASPQLAPVEPNAHGMPGQNPPQALELQSNTGLPSIGDAHSENTTVVTEHVSSGIPEQNQVETVAENTTGTKSSKPRSGSSTGKAKDQIKRASFDKPENLPDEDAELMDDQITKLLSQSRVVRSKYKKYFASHGTLRRPWFKLIFQKSPNGELVHEESIIRSNVPKWKERLQQFDMETEISSEKARRQGLTSPSFKRTASEDEDFQDSRTQESKKPKRVKAASKPDGGTQEVPLPPQPAQPAQPARPAQPTNRPFSPLFVPASNPPPISMSTSDLNTIYASRPTLAHGYTTIPEPGHYTIPRLPRITLERAPRVHQSAQVARVTSNQYSDPSLSDLRRHFDNDLCHYIRQYQKGDINLLQLDDLIGFLKWIDVQAHTLNHELVKFAVSEKKDYQGVLISVAMQLLRLRAACLNLQEAIKKEKGIADKTGSENEKQTRQYLPQESLGDNENGQMRKEMAKNTDWEVTMEE